MNEVSEADKQVYSGESSVVVGVQVLNTIGGGYEATSRGASAVALA